MKTATVVARLLLGLGFVVFGANILHPFLPVPPMDPQSLPARFGAIMMETHWMQVIGAFQLVGGLLVLSGRAAPLGLSLLAPVLVNIWCFHLLVMGGAGLGPGAFFTALEAFLIYAYRPHFAPLFSRRAAPAV
jgi:hypothetical protein